MKELAEEVGIVPATLVLLKIDWNQLLDTLRLWTIFVYHF